MSGLSKGEKYLAKVMIPGFVGVAALCYLAWRPCEPIAHAAAKPASPANPPAVQVGPEAPVLNVGVVTIVAKAPSKGSPRGVAGVRAKSAMACTDSSPEWHCWSRPLQMGTAGTSVQECDCDPAHGQ